MLTIELFTPSDDPRPVFLVGNFNGWKARDQHFMMEQVKEGHYRFEFSKPLNVTGPIEYKYIKGGWESEELTEGGYPPGNRRAEMTNKKVRDTVPKWKRHEGWYDAQFYPDIQIISKGFNLPQLGRQRRISILLPWNYHTEPEKRFPVLYLQDGQNLFEDSGPYGTWGVDKQLARLAQNGKGAVIVVAIDHGGKDRIKEFLPYGSLKWGEGLGREYARFLGETLKPYVDSQFRTKPERTQTGIGGSSMGGLISIYAGLMFPEIFSKFMVFSPSLWVSPRIFTDAKQFAKVPATKIYLYAGGKEGAGMVTNAQKMQETLQKRGLAPGALDFKLEVDPEGHHNEARWGQEFPKAIEWLFYESA